MEMVSSALIGTTIAAPAKKNVRYVASPSKPLYICYGWLSLEFVMAIQLAWPNRRIELGVCFDGRGGWTAVIIPPLANAVTQN
jgi:hypothetical protein